MPAQGGEQEAAGTRKARVRQARSLAEPRRPARSVTPLGSHGLCCLDSSTALSLLPLVQTSAPSLQPQLQLQASLIRASGSGSRLKCCCPPTAITTPTTQSRSLPTTMPVLLLVGVQARKRASSTSLLC